MVETDEKMRLNRRESDEREFPLENFPERERDTYILTRLPKSHLHIAVTEEKKSLFSLHFWTLT